MTPVPFPVYDADNHLYEPEEAFMRHLPKKYENDFYMVERKGRKKLVIGGRLSEYIPNPTFEVVATPGSYEMWYRGQNPEGLTLREFGGKLLRTPPEFRTGDGRIKVLDQQGLQGAMVFPTLASVIEVNLGHNAELTAALFHSLNSWIDEEWGFSRDNRLFSVPMISLADIDTAVTELDFVLKRGARVVGIRPAPVPGVGGSRSFGFPEYDPFWARVADAGIFVALHSSATEYAQIANWWRGTSGAEYLPFEKNPLVEVIGKLGRPISDSVAAMICHGLFDRNPNLRVVSVENGAAWVAPLLHRLGIAYGRMPQAFKQDPRDALRRHVYVAPFYEDDVNELPKEIPVERIVFGSDFPHPEGLEEPLRYLDDFKDYKPDDLEKVFSSNLKGLLEGKRDNLATV